MHILQGDRVLFQGDSITDAFRKPEEINDTYQMGAGFAMLVAARIRFQRPDDSIEFINRGISGHRLANLQVRWQQDCLDLKPDVLSLLVGVNDTLSSGVVEEWGKQYRALLQMTLKELPNIRLILCEPYLLPNDHVTADQLVNISERQAEFRCIVEDFPQAAVVRFQDAFNQATQRAPANYWAYDGIHPTAAGNELLARTWLDTVTP